MTIDTAKEALEALECLACNLAKYESLVEFNDEEEQTLIKMAIELEKFHTFFEEELKDAAIQTGPGIDHSHLRKHFDENGWR